MALHLGELGGRGRAVDIADHELPHLGRADVVDDVQRKAQILEHFEILRVGGPADRLAIDRQVARLEPAVQRGVRRAFAVMMRGDALPQPRLRRAAVLNVNERALSHQIDEARSDDAIACVDHAPRRDPRASADLRDATAANPNAATEPRVARAIDDASVYNREIEGRLGGEGRQTKCERNHKGASNVGQQGSFHV